MTEIERELNNLRRLLSDARRWNWIDFAEMTETQEGLAEARLTLPDLVDLDLKIAEATGEGLVARHKVKT